MESSTDQTFVPRSVVDALHAQAMVMGLSVESMVGELGLGLPRGPDGKRLPLSQFLRLQTRLPGSVGGQLGVLSARPALVAFVQQVASQLPERARLVDVMQAAAKCFATMRQGTVTSVERRVDVFAFVVDDRLDDPLRRRDESVLFSMETSLLFVHALFRLAAPGSATSGWRGVELVRIDPPLQVPFERHVPTSLGHRRYALLYERASAEQLLAKEALGAVTVEAVTEEQVRMLESGVQDRTFSGRVRMLIEEGAGDQTAVARALGMSVATLRRRLVEEGASFRALRVETLKRRAEVLLEGQAPLSQVADKLGFSDVRSFSRAYKAWTGTTPNASRRLKSAKR